ncbi:MBL fold metallo-hydrolase [bacterium]|nr:MBL fold metallo-hydrolase [bacterium]
MNIIWQGKYFFEIKTKGRENLLVDVFVNPYFLRKNSQTDSDSRIALFFSKEERERLKDKSRIGEQTFLIDKPGEFDIKGVFILGIPVFSESDNKLKKMQIIYKIESEGVKICFLPKLGDKDLNDQQFESISDVDVLVIPIGSGFGFEPKSAVSVVSEIEPKAVIPICSDFRKGFKREGGELGKFLKAIGAQESEPQKKIRLTARDFSGEGEESKIIILSPQKE